MKLKRFKVSLQRILPNPDIRNPFLVNIEAFPPSKMLVRTWEFDTKDENEVRRLLKKAQAAGIPSVQGMEVREILVVKG